MQGKKYSDMKELYFLDLERKECSIKNLQDSWDPVKV